MHISRAATSDAGRELAEQRFASGSQLAGLGVGVDRQRHRRAMDVPCGDDVHRVPVIEHEASRAQLTRVSRPRIPPLSTARPHRRCGSRWGRSTCSGMSVALAPRAAIRIPTALRSRLQPMEWPMSEMPDGWFVDVDGEKVVINFPVEHSPSIGPFASRSLPPHASGGPVPCPLGRLRHRRRM